MDIIKKVQNPLLLNIANKINQCSQYSIYIKNYGKI